MGLNRDITLRLKATVGANVFIETGTYKAVTALWAAQEFRYVTSIEVNSQRFMKTLTGIGHTPPDLRLINGDSAVKLPEIMEAYLNAGPMVFYLDAHWMNIDESAEGQDVTLTQCPLLDELLAINRHADAAEHVIIIDDLRLFNGQLEAGNIASHWPSLDNIRGMIFQHPRAMAYHGDVLYAVPKRYKDQLFEAVGQVHTGAEFGVVEESGNG